jgi:hypothetical protein
MLGVLLVVLAQAEEEQGAHVRAQVAALGEVTAAQYFVGFGGGLAADVGVQLNRYFGISLAARGSPMLSGYSYDGQLDLALLPELTVGRVSLWCGPGAMIFFVTEDGFRVEPLPALTAGVALTFGAVRIGAEAWVAPPFLAYELLITSFALTVGYAWR